MAGVKGRSGGARPNTGGARPGAGRPPNPKPEPAYVPDGVDSLDVLRQIAMGRIDASPVQLRAVIEVVQYEHTKKADAGKKKARQEQAAEVASKFGARPAPLKVVGAK